MTSKTGYLDQDAVQKIVDQFRWVLKPLIDEVHAHRSPMHVDYKNVMLSQCHVSWFLWWNLKIACRQDRVNRCSRKKIG